MTADAGTIIRDVLQRHRSSSAYHDAIAKARAAGLVDAILAKLEARGERGDAARMLELRGQPVAPADAPSASDPEPTATENPLAARILDVTAEEYHRRPGLSSSIAKVLIARSPLHAKEALSRAPTKGMDRGAAIHELVLGAGKSFAVLPFDDFRTKAAQQARDEARTQGLVPIKEGDFAEYQVAARKIVDGLRERGIVLDGASEVAIEWYEPSKSGPVLCRALLDHLWLDSGLILDLKITADAAQEAIERTAESLGYAIQSTAYTRAVAALRSHLAGRVDFLFAFCEAEPPYAMNLTRPDGVFRELGERRWLRAVETWGRCQATDTWPAFGTGINPLSPPAWALAKEEFAS